MTKCIKVSNRVSSLHYSPKEKVMSDEVCC